MRVLVSPLNMNRRIISMFTKEKLIESIKKTILFKKFKKTFYQTSEKNYVKPILDDLSCDILLKKLLLSDRPCMISRLGSTELKTMEYHYKKKEYSKSLKYIMKNNAGVYPIDTISLNKFSKLYFEKISNIDLLGIWFNPFEDIIANKFCSNAKLTLLKNLEPYFSDSPWSSYLKGKKVLVIHPFVSSLEFQYNKRNQLFENKNILPRFEFIPYKAVQSIGGNDDFDSWFDALDHMQNDIKKIDFDIAIIGAGAYGLPLASFVKEIGKKSIHLGGATQMLFGVYGQRWKIDPNFNDIINEHWIQPSEDEKPNNAHKVENACYW